MATRAQGASKEDSCPPSSALIVPFLGLQSLRWTPGYLRLNLNRRFSGGLRGVKLYSNQCCSCLQNNPNKYELNTFGHSATSDDWFMHWIKLFFIFSLGQWTEWSPCTSPCINSIKFGTKERTRTCNPRKYSKNGGCAKVKLIQKKKCKSACDPEGMLTFLDAQATRAPLSLWF